MRKKFGKLMQAAGALLLFILACASDMGAESVMGLAGGLPCAALLFLTGRRLTRRRKPAARRRTRCAHEVIPLTQTM